MKIEVGIEMEVGLEKRIGLGMRMGIEMEMELGMGLGRRWKWTEERGRQRSKNDKNFTFSILNLNRFHPLKENTVFLGARKVWTEQRPGLVSKETHPKGWSLNLAITGLLICMFAIVGLLGELAYLYWGMPTSSLSHTHSPTRASEK